MFLGIIAEVSSIVCWWINDDWQWNVHTLTRCCHRCTYTVYRMYSCCYCLKLTKNNKTNWKKYMGDLIFTLKESVCGKRNCPDQQRLVHCDVEEEVTRSLTRVNREANSSWTIANITVDLCELNNRFSPVRSNMLYAWLWPHSGKPQDNAITSFIIKKNGLLIVQKSSIWHIDWFTWGQRSERTCLLLTHNLHVVSFGDNWCDTQVSVSVGF